MVKEMLNSSGVRILHEKHSVDQEWAIVKRVVFMPENYIEE
jgi:hypothetical protein